MLKTNMCGELQIKDIGAEVVLAGWVARRRDHGGLTFIDLRDSSGTIQIVIKNEKLNLSEKELNQIRNEWVLGIKGLVTERQEGTRNPNMPTGDIEVSVIELEIINPSNTPPFPINEDLTLDEANRMKYRYLDLRRSKMNQNLKLRHDVMQFIRNFLSNKKFIEIETPILNVATPEGARDYVVPSRIHPGKFYALPQSPQQWKQLLMVSGFEKYFQIARCFRDEDLRSDRQPEFTQLDIEISFVEEKDILLLIEELMVSMLKELNLGFEFSDNFPLIPYAESIEKYGTDKPDLRFELEITDLSSFFNDTSIKIFADVLKKGQRIRGIHIPGGNRLTKKQLQELNEIAKLHGALGVASMHFDNDYQITASKYHGFSSLLEKFINIDELLAINNLFKIKPGDAIIISAGEDNLTSQILADIRNEIASMLDLTEDTDLAFCFITEFPMFEYSETAKKWTAMHHLFTMPFEEDMQYISTEPARVRSHAYDLVCNGQEVGSGSIRIHKSELLLKILKQLDIDESTAREQFGHMLDAFEFGAPPHGGIAPGIDRIVALLAKESDIREVIAFPKTKTASDLLSGAPSEIEQKNLDELHLKIDKSSS
ncbi:MAG: aspartate--tRNA ligase [Dehalococcoidaceae bacterium]|nr:aspartate--tRNA ligase [Dehalococcoidaceae bacterium]